MPENTRQIVLIETSANQSYIFSTNKRREVVGASELVHRVSAAWLDAALPPLNERVPEIDVLVNASGKILLVAPDAETAKRIIGRVTEKAIDEAPGLDVCGLFAPYDDCSATNAAAAISAIHRRFQGARSLRPGPEERFPRLPVVAECHTSGFPATSMKVDGEEPPGPRSAQSAAKLKAASEGSQRLLALTSATGTAGSGWRILEHLEASDWVAVVHADGNSLGKLFLELGSRAPDNYPARLRDLSFAIQEATEQALGDASRACSELSKQYHGVLPLIAGGDDVTVICRGEDALIFAEQFLLAFERRTQREEIAPLLDEHSRGRLTAAVGVAIVKPHFPFSMAYELCESLTKSAKKVKLAVQNDARETVPCSSIDFHVLYDSTDADLDRIRADLGRRSDPLGPMLVARPYVISDDLEALAAAAPQSAGWIRRHSWNGLKERAVALKNGTDTAPALPRSPVHALRSALFLGDTIANIRAEDLRRRYPGHALSGVFGAEATLFVPAVGVEATDCTHVTGLLDALEAADFLSI